MLLYLRKSTFNRDKTKYCFRFIFMPKQQHMVESFYIENKFSLSRHGEKPTLSINHDFTWFFANIILSKDVLCVIRAVNDNKGNSHILSFESCVFSWASIDSTKG